MTRTGSWSDACGVIPDTIIKRKKNAANSPAPVMCEISDEASIKNRSTD